MTQHSPMHESNRTHCGFHRLDEALFFYSLPSFFFLPYTYLFPFLFFPLSHRFFSLFTLLLFLLLLLGCSSLSPHSSSFIISLLFFLLFLLAIFSFFFSLLFFLIFFCYFLLSSSLLFFMCVGTFNLEHKKGFEECM